MVSLLTLLVLTTISLIFIFLLKKDIKLLMVHLPLMFLTPWVITLFLGKPSFADYLNTKPAHFFFLKSIAFMSSTDFLFFQNFPNLSYIVGDYGDFLPSFIPLIATGLWFLLTSKKLEEKRIIFIFFGALLTSSLLFNLVGYLSATIFCVFLSIFATFGFLKFISILKEKKAKFIIKSLIIVNLLLIIYESLMLYHSLNVQINLKI